MRQVGVLAAAGLVALEEDSSRACSTIIATRGSSPRDSRASPEFRSTPRGSRPTSPSSTSAGQAKPPPRSAPPCASAAVLMNAINERQMRAVTHYDVDRAIAPRRWKPSPPWWHHEDSHEQCTCAISSLLLAAAPLSRSRSSTHHHRCRRRARPHARRGDQHLHRRPRRVAADSAGNVYFSANQLRLPARQQRHADAGRRQLAAPDFRATADPPSTLS